MLIQPQTVGFPAGKRGEMSQTLSEVDKVSPIVNIPQNEYKHLVKIARKYNTLCNNLRNGGVQQETLNLLSSQTAPASSDPEGQFDISSYHSTTSTDGPEKGQGLTSRLASYSTPFHTGSGHVLRPHTHSSFPLGTWQETQAFGRHTTSSDGSESDSPDPPKRSSLERIPRLDFERVTTRTVQLCNLPKHTTLADITSVVRGGFLVDIFLRTRDNTVALSFLHSRDAHAFYDYAQKNGLNINGTGVEVRWNDRQFVLAGHIAHKIGLGACRNLVVRHCNPNQKEQDIIDDLEHIHNLTVISVEFTGGHCFISTNSVNAAMFARTCMMSRFKYKGSRIEWGVDECAQPLHKLPTARPRHAEIKSNRAQSSGTNRFELLCLEE
ncbi:hypothetical protein E4U43_003182 [Claviceps pusilla]|uniref:RRM domain-containing protein n=1 Tax=Claviceps pusilla TaxID=123648 RepID=A0A9P7NG02_9HYPO|nr:hypothetical protein E4U43_003182 [Claviceps pusilla]